MTLLLERDAELHREILHTINRFIDELRQGNLLASVTDDSLPMPKVEATTAVAGLKKLEPILSSWKDEAESHTVSKSALTNDYEYPPSAQSLDQAVAEFKLRRVVAEIADSNERHSRVTKSKEKDLSSAQIRRASISEDKIQYEGDSNRSIGDEEYIQGTEKKEAVDSMSTQVLSKLRLEGVLQTLTRLLSQAASCAEIIDVMETIRVLMLCNLPIQQEFVHVNGYMFIFQLLDRFEYDSEEQSVFLKQVFDILFTIALDGHSSHLVGNLDALQWIVAVTCLSKKLDVRLQGLQTLMDLISVNPHNAAAIQYVHGVDILQSLLRDHSHTLQSNFVFSLSPHGSIPSWMYDMCQPVSFGLEAGAVLVGEIDSLLKYIAITLCNHNMQIIHSYSHILSNYLDLNHTRAADYSYISEQSIGNPDETTFHARTGIESSINTQADTFVLAPSTMVSTIILRSFVELCADIHMRGKYVYLSKNVKVSQSPNINSSPPLNAGADNKKQTNFTDENSDLEHTQSQMVSCFVKVLQFQIMDKPRVLKSCVSVKENSNAIPPSENATNSSAEKIHFAIDADNQDMNPHMTSQSSSHFVAETSNFSLCLGSVLESFSDALEILLRILECLGHLVLHDRKESLLAFFDSDGLSVLVSCMKQDKPVRIQKVAFWLFSELALLAASYELEPFVRECVKNIVKLLHDAVSDERKIQIFTFLQYTFLDLSILCRTEDFDTNAFNALHCLSLFKSMPSFGILATQFYEAFHTRDVANSPTHSHMKFCSPMVRVENGEKGLNLLKLLFLSCGGIDALLHLIRTSHKTIATMAFRVFFLSYVDCFSAKQYIVRHLGFAAVASFLRDSRLDLDKQFLLSLLELSTSGCVSRSVKLKSLFSPILIACVHWLPEVGYAGSILSPRLLLTCKQPCSRRLIATGSIPGSASDLCRKDIWTCLVEQEEHMSFRDIFDSIMQHQVGSTVHDLSAAKSGNFTSQKLESGHTKSEVQMERISSSHSLTQQSPRSNISGHSLASHHSDIAEATGQTLSSKVEKRESGTDDSKTNHANKSCIASAPNLSKRSGISTPQLVPWKASLHKVTFHNTDAATVFVAFLLNAPVTIQKYLLKLVSAMLLSNSLNMRVFHEVGFSQFVIRVASKLPEKLLQPYINLIVILESYHCTREEALALLMACQNENLDEKMLYSSANGNFQSVSAEVLCKEDPLSSSKQSEVMQGILYITF